ncbi:MAG: hypothetical protein COU09_02185 [Candidatus Harrisonbacteria bacterium CG10_big_fil_rev_8_21_14_0_10_44_23]|uniref:Uncharacterized protein n=1 Tax=Candidatus Harrisonbacteria bacterium CG10_big_fil_rev_8_21_14_0_10_44_23 TaxID=1974585 RepID=A0A2H0UPY5_9BACT|nr:MAG: hypothetical protein COU09_02185 [Candidatus Harrisonbacteria bacterium CG10_big_fil_rev_8_21_14_0_10_44_23]
MCKIKIEDVARQARVLLDHGDAVEDVQQAVFDVLYGESVLDRQEAEWRLSDYNSLEAQSQHLASTLGWSKDWFQAIWNQDTDRHAWLTRQRRINFLCSVPAVL